MSIKMGMVVLVNKIPVAGMRGNPISASQPTAGVELVLSVPDDPSQDE